MDKTEIIDQILTERKRQDDKWNFPQSNNFAEWGTIVGEEFGELMTELNEAHFRVGDKGKLITEAIHVAAVAMSIIEHYEVAVENYDSYDDAPELVLPEEKRIVPLIFIHPDGTHTWGCFNCGHTIEKNENRCSNCGTKPDWSSNG